MHSNSLQVAPTGELLMSVRMLDTVIAISPRFDRIAWRSGGSVATSASPIRMTSSITSILSGCWRMAIF